MRALRLLTIAWLLLLAGAAPQSVDAGLISIAGLRAPQPEPPPSGDAPSWFTSAPANTWTQIPISNLVTDVADPLSSSTNAGDSGFPGGWQSPWVGMFLDKDNRIMGTLAQGGHQDYHGNEVYTVTLDETPVWERRRNASANGLGDASATGADGRPVASHTAGNSIAAEGRWFNIGLWAPSGPGSNGHPARYFEFDWDGSNDWIDLGQPWTPIGSPSHTHTAYDPVDRQIIKIMGETINLVFSSIDNMAGAPVVINQTGSYGNLDSANVDSTNRVLLMHTAGGGGFWYTARLNSTANKQATFTTVSYSGTQPDVSDGFVWHAPSNAFLSWQRGGDIIKITPTVSGGAYTGLTGSVVSIAGTSPPFGAISGGLYHRIDLIPDMGNGDAMFIIGFPDTNNPGRSWFVRLTGGL